MAINTNEEMKAAIALQMAAWGGEDEGEGESEEASSDEEHGHEDDVDSEPTPCGSRRAA